ncbi:neugrin [Plakobranchus ocellatus]|uniref:Neugrin n=1 Tax=Plakobranchus ocellatus TaxID=259542 RepID=A0AAV4ANE1_9GAST|nr:neugrin [Plakobranchus ocellatus]
MFASARYLTSISKQAVNIIFETQTSSTRHVLYVLPLASQVSLQQQQSSKASNRSSLQVIKPMRVTSVGKRFKKLTSEQAVEKKKRGKVLAEPLQWPNLTDDEFDSYEDKVASMVSQYSSKISAHNAEDAFTQSMVRQLNAVKSHTIRQKHFKPAPFPDLLTWAAKKQIRFLHDSDPDQWSISALVEHYPVSEKALKELLKAKRKILQVEDILRHDRRILKNWDNLHAQLESRDMSEETFEVCLKYFFNEQNDCLISNALSLPNVPCPKTVARSKKRGPFSMIVEDCLAIQEKQAQILLEDEIPLVAQQLSSKLEDTTCLIQALAALWRKGNRDFFLADSHNKHPDVRTGYVSSSNQKVGRTFHTRSRPPTTSARTSSHLKSSISDPVPNKSIYISGKTVYDEHGEFLYRIP